ncbi:hypothetical protein [Dyadobacter jiangsuensis]|uniref:Uncharacterized protein n=1 Tax=Dyadobacter jiangsuensis TaxID=1591085 RepID=A0A2P8FP49_9BACT|nr:hypothetical protein [Dyadobacter jiangsuensis]PSL23477.1 hypothetical protein CLV60_11632 [Dyadobacter jiangsuensis]
MSKPKTPASPKVAKDLLSSFLETLHQGFETDTNLETSAGVAFDYGRYGTFILRRAVHRNHAYVKAMKEKVLPYLEARGEVAEGEEDQRANQLMAEIYTDTVIVGLKTADGVSIPYNDDAKEGLVRLFLAAPDLFTKIQSDASDAANFRKKRTEAEAKN